MSFFLLIIWQCFFVLQLLEWPMLGLQIERPITAMTMVAAFIIFLLTNKKKHFGPEFWLLSAFVATIIVSGFANGWLGGGVARAQTFILTAFLPYVLYSNHAISISKQRFILFLLLFFGLLMITNGMSQLSSNDGIGWVGSRLVDERIAFLGVLQDPNDLGQYFVMCIPFAAYFMRNGTLVFSRLAAGAVLLLLCYGIYMTNSRGTLLSVMSLLLCYIYYRFGTKKAIVTLALLSPAVIFVFSRFRAIELDSSAMDRADTWFTGMQLLEQNPIFGVGMGNFMEYSQLTTHNSFVLVMSELGFVGYILWLSLIIISLVTTLHVARHYRNLLIQNEYKRLPSTELSRALSLNSTILFSLIGFLFCAFFISRSYSAFLFMICAFSVASYIRVTRLAPELKINQPRMLFRYTIAGSFGSIIGMYGVVRILLT